MKTTIDADFSVTDEMRGWAESRMPLVNIDKETEKFIDYWLSCGKAMADWTATWRQWIRRAPDFKGAALYTSDELRIKKLMTKFTAKGFRRAFTHENSVAYDFAFQHWQATKDGVPQRDMGVVRQLAQAKRA